MRHSDLCAGLNAARRLVGADRAMPAEGGAPVAVSMEPKLRLSR